jgi:hypothetical protein
VQQERPVSQRQQAGLESQSRPVYSSTGQYAGPDLETGDIAGRVAQDVFGGYGSRAEFPGRDEGVNGFKPVTVSTTSHPGSQFGGQFRDIVPRGYGQNIQECGENPYDAVNNRIENAGRFADNDLRTQNQSDEGWRETRPERPKPQFEDEMLVKRVQRGAQRMPGLGKSVSTSPQPGKVIGGQFGRLAEDAEEAI